MLLIGPLGTNFSEILIEIQKFSFKKIHLKISSGKWRPFCLVLNVLKQPQWNKVQHNRTLISNPCGLIKMTSSNGNFFCVTGHLWGGFTAHWWIPRTKASDAEIWCFFSPMSSINGWVNNLEAGDLRRHCANYDVIVMDNDLLLGSTRAGSTRPGNAELL